MAHELSHVLLDSLRHPDRDSELHTDLVPLVLGFRACVRTGRKEVQSTMANDGRLQTQTSIYGYLTDKQFEYACDIKHFASSGRR